MYALCVEKLKKMFLGVFTLTDSASPERCGTEFGSRNRVYSTVQLRANNKTKIKMANMLGQLDDKCTTVVVTPSN